jgi:UDP-N-acetylglucosamine 4-epimerase
VIPRWTAAMLRREKVYIFGDGETSRDFCYIDNVVQANILAGDDDQAEAANEVYNVAVGEQTSLNELFATLHTLLAARIPVTMRRPRSTRTSVPGDVRFSRADISKARKLLGYQPTITSARAWNGPWIGISGRSDATRSAVTKTRPP